jgi:hypothetical protein
MSDFILVLTVCLLTFISIEAKAYETETNVTIREVFNDGFLVVDKLKACEKRLKKGKR